ncbi:MAG TPA: hypothetical protein VMU29_00260 [Smithella sp.]|nr:hypothetical protein [Smithella sp.]
MNVKGIFYVVTKTNMVAVFGEERWKDFMDKLAKKDKYFGVSVLMAVTPIPVDKLIFLFDEMCREFFNNDKTQYETFGKVGAKYALSQGGSYSSYMLTKDTKQFVETSLPKIYLAYFDGGRITTRLENNVVHFIVIGIEVKNAYFELLLKGYFQKAIRIFGKKSIVRQIRSIASGDEDIYFTFELIDS